MLCLAELYRVPSGSCTYGPQAVPRSGPYTRAWMAYRGGNPMLRAVIFDLDGLLVDSNPLHYRAWGEILRGIGLPLTWEDYCDLWIRAGLGVEAYLARYGIDSDAQQLRRRKRVLYHGLLETELQPIRARSICLEASVRTSDWH